MADLERIEARYLLLEMAKKKNVTMTRAILERALDAIYSKRRNLRITESVFVNEGYVNLIPKQPEESVLAAPYPKDDASLGTPAAPYPKDDASLGTPAALALPHNFDSHSRLASRQWSLAPNQNSEEPPCQILDSSGCFGISD